MAEGHVVRYNAERFHRLLAGRRIVYAFWRSRRVPISPADVEGKRVRKVTFAGKNHLFVLEDGGTFRVHLMMFGSTQAGPRGEPLRKPEARVRFRLETDDARVVVFSAPLVEFYPPGAPIPAVEALGPDATKPRFDADEFVRRLSRAPQATVAEALLAPDVVAGVGNVYKSEILWLARIDPEKAPAQLSSDERTRLARLVPRVMVEAYENLRDGRNLRERRAMYRRSGKPCPACGATIAYKLVGGRRTFGCPQCQSFTAGTRRTGGTTGRRATRPS